MARDRFKRALASFFWVLLGRRRMVRFGQFLVNTRRNVCCCDVQRINIVSTCREEPCHTGQGSNFILQQYRDYVTHRVIVRGK